MFRLLRSSLYKFYKGFIKRVFLSFVKYIDIFSYSFKGRTKDYIKLIDYQGCLDSLLYSSSDTNNFFILTRRKIVGKMLKNNYIIACKTPKRKQKNTYERQDCNRQ